MRKPLLPIPMQEAFECKSFIQQLVLFWVLFLSAGSIDAQPNTPKFETYKPINTTQSNPQIPNQSGSSPRLNPLFPNDPNADRNLRIMQQGGMDIPGQATRPKSQRFEEARAVLEEEAADNRKIIAQPFEQAFREFAQLNPGKFSITRAVYLAEKAYDQSMPPFEIFETAIREWGELVKQILHREGLSTSNNTAVLYAIQKLFTQPNAYFNNRAKSRSIVQPIRYDFDDPMGDKDWRKMFVNKLLKTGTGQCHSLPLFFLCIAEQLNAKAYLSLSPNHSFIQYFDSTGRRYNFECTNGNMVTQTWLMQSTYVNATALKNGTYLDTLSAPKLYAQCLADLMLGYISKIGYDQFSDVITSRILAIDPANIAALMTRANYHSFMFKDKLNAAGNPPQSDYPQYPQLYIAFNSMQEARQKVENTGFQEMPAEAYKKWLKSLEQEKQKQQNLSEQERLKREIERLKKIKVIIKNYPKR